MVPATAKVEDKNPGAGDAKSMGIFMVDVVGIRRRVRVFVGKDYYYYSIMCQNHTSSNSSKKSIVAGLRDHVCQCLLKGIRKKIVI